MAKTSSVYTVSEVAVEVYRSEPPSALIAVTGETVTAGWRNLSLRPRDVKPPSDGIWDFDLVGDPPLGPALQMVESVQTSIVWQYPKDAVGVRVHAAVGPAIVRMFADAQVKREASLLRGGGEKPLPWAFGGEKPLPWVFGSDKPCSGATLPSLLQLEGALKATLAIGGETTGMTINTTVDIDLSRVPHKDLKNKVVSVLGWFEVRHYVERGPRLTFVASLAPEERGPNRS